MGRVHIPSALLVFCGGSGPPLEFAMTRRTETPARVRELRFQAEKAELAGFVVQALRLTAAADAMEERLEHLSDVEPELVLGSDLPTDDWSRDRW